MSPSLCEDPIAIHHNIRERKVGCQDLAAGEWYSSDCVIDEFSMMCNIDTKTHSFIIISRLKHFVENISQANHLKKQSAHPP